MKAKLDTASLLKDFMRRFERGCTHLSVGNVGDVGNGG